MGYSLMRATIVVILHVFLDTLSQSSNIVLWIDVDILSFDGMPEAFYPYIVLTAATAIHADLDTVFLTGGQPKAACVLTALVGIDDLWRSMCFHSQTKHLDAVLFVKRVV